MRGKEEALTIAIFQTQTTVLILKDTDINSKDQMRSCLGIKVVFKATSNSEYDAQILSSRDFCQNSLRPFSLFRTAAQTNCQLADCELLALHNEHKIEFHDNPISAPLCRTDGVTQSQTINGKIAKDVLRFMWEDKTSPKIIAEPIFGTNYCNFIEDAVANVLSSNTQQLEQHKAEKPSCLFCGPI